MAIEEPIYKDEAIRDLSQVTVNALKDLEMAKRSLQEKDIQMKEINNLANRRIEDMSGINKQLQDQITYVESMTRSAQEKNRVLELNMKKLEAERNTFDKLNNNLKIDLEKVTQKEKELEIKQTFLETKIKEQTEKLVRTEKMAIIGQFASRLGHDIRNPLYLIKISYEILRKNQKLSITDKIKALEKINLSVSKISYIVNDVLDFVKVTKINVQKEPINDIIDSTLESIHIPTNIRIEKIVNEGIVLCDFKKMEAVFVNLLTNAMDSIREDGGTIIIRTIEKHDKVEVQVEDSGPGVPASIKSKIFDPLYTTRMYGSGLGLPICKMIVEQHGSSLQVQSTPSIFSMELPRVV